MKRILLLWLAVSLLAGCSLLPGGEPAAAPVSALPGGAFLTDEAAIRAETVSLIRQARTTIWIEQFIFSDAELLALLIEKAQAGVEIRLLLDQWQTANQPTIETLKNNNISVQYYPAQKGQYQRVRCMLTDGGAALVYSSDWLENPPPLRRLAVRLEGEAAWELARNFAADWKYTTTLALELPPDVEAPDDHITLNTGAALRQSVLNQIEGASREILAESIQISQEDVLNALIAARQRGCLVRLILNPDVVDSTPNSLERLRAAGVEIRLFRAAAGETAETIDYTFAVFDGQSLIVAASAWSHAAFVINHEIALTIPSPAGAEKMQALFASDWENGAPWPSAPPDEQQSGVSRAVR
ncbi:MAG: phosphatidylserine/phosphatidylglycerophosphate/cardiolipin synthase family protein [Gracilibacteraceae bacterium]|jgi:phosphatidylserine/phosphatidylglycerophosphate/cardiolipin synthase-like enzyme|nr:phosphatidylserine/phosphatidylglycerophosphate/cardiolipin synthase family protein [Gracilibacteraceae bacterium]